jgi:two-component system, OmpR family, response regulator
VPVEILPDTRLVDMNETIMIVDDSSLVVDGIVAILKRHGYKPLAAYGGDECLEIVKTTVPDLILLDLMMEPMDGWETLDRLKANPETKGIPVLMFSSKKISPAEAQEHRLSIDDFVSKPVNITKLMASIQRIFTRRNDVNGETLIAQNAGVDKALIDEHTALRTSTEVDKNLLVVLKHSTGANTPGHEVPAEDLAAMQKIEEKIKTDELRLKEINGKFTKPA